MTKAIKPTVERIIANAPVLEFWQYMLDDRKPLPNDTLKRQFILGAAGIKLNLARHSLLWQYNRAGRIWAQKQKIVKK